MKNNIIKRTIILLICIKIIILIVIGCKDKFDNNEKKHDALTLCNIKSFISDDFFNNLKEMYPEINFEITNFSGNNISGYSRETLRQGDIPDIYISTQPFDKKSQKKYLVDLSGYKFINNYTTTSLSQVENNGEIYLLPTYL